VSASYSKPNRLGRGLDALIPTEVDEFASQEVAQALHLDQDIVHKIPVDQIDPNPFQPRKDFNDADLADLATSIKLHGVVQPLVAAKNGQRYQLIAGERRLRAAKLANKQAVPVILRSLDEQQQLEVAVIENIQRAELSPLELAVAYQKLVDQFNLTTEAISKRVGKAAPTVRNIMRLLKLPYEAKKALQEGAIVEGQARSILTIEDPQEQVKMLKMVIKQDMTVRQTEEMARNWKQDKELVSKRVEKKVSDYQSAIDGLGQRLGTKIEVLNNAQGGRVVIRFFSHEELARIYEEITGEKLV
jgi:ParB family chromosome partitioning protein